MKDCLFCGIIEGKVKGELVYEDPSVVAFKDIGPKAPVHILIVPRKHIASLLDLEPSDGPLVGAIFRVAVSACGMGRMPVPRPKAACPPVSVSP